MTERETTIHWRDPAEGLTALPELDGIDFMTKMRDGELPGAPMASHLGMTLTEVGPGTVTFQCHPDESHYNPIGMVHGGLWSPPSSTPPSDAPPTPLSPPAPATPPSRSR
ncbi:PaaI family thioesterase [Dietzia aerolata]|uniref:PaaI family thioesterase n=1 Tax=Dietzia aerolata TaxID=595984 RepID=A0ABV5JR45_9ACTN|nr:hypothetical protein [Dietzia aerolata]